MIRRIWVTLSDRTPSVLRGVRLDIYWDNATTPAVSAPFGDFFGQGLGRCQVFQSALFSNPEKKSFNCYVPMPFRSAFKIVLTNESEIDVAMLFYDVDFTVGDNLAESALYLHAHWRRENPTKMQEDYEFLPKIYGRGRYLGVNVSVIGDRKTYFSSWWGEGECKVYLDGDEQLPTLSGTGTEDYIGTAWGQGQYSHLYQGCHLADEENWQYAFYRYHIPDPIFFYHDIRVTMQQIGCWSPENMKEFVEAGRQLIITGPGKLPLDMGAALAANGFGLYERQDDWSSCCYFYLDKPENELPPLAHVSERVKGLLPPTIKQKTSGLM